ncbi:hypothetical protein [Microbulbifer sp. TB1203]|nr:hypothetical protein [Microbulbifer sp. TB1203]
MYIARALLQGAELVCWTKSCPKTLRLGWLGKEARAHPAGDLRIPD